MTQRAFPSLADDNSESYMNMVRSNGDISVHAAEHGLLPLHDRDINLERAANGQWLVSFLDTLSHERVESGFGRSAADAYAEALRLYAGDGEVFVVRVDEWTKDSPETPSGGVYALSGGSLTEALAALAIERGPFGSYRAWKCDGGVIVTL